MKNIMKRNFRNIILLFITITLLQSAFSQSEKFGKMIYTVPPGWKLTKYQDGARISPADLPQENISPSR